MTTMADASGRRQVNELQLQLSPDMLQVEKLAIFDEMRLKMRMKKLPSGNAMVKIGFKIDPAGLLALEWRNRTSP